MSEIKPGEYGIVFFTEGPRKGQRGEYDDDEYDGRSNSVKAIVYLHGPNDPQYELHPFEHLRHATPVEMEQVEWGNRATLKRLEKEGKA